MLAFILRRVALLIPTFIGITIAAFAFIRLLPGDPVLLMAGERGLTPERHAELMHQLGFDRPISLQYFDFLTSALSGDLGQSVVTKRPVFDEFLTLFPATLELTFCAMIFAVVLGIPAGIIAATRRGSWLDQALMGTALVGYSMPIFWWGLLLIILFSGMLGWTPVSGRISLLYYFPPVTGFMLIDSLMSGQKGAFASAAVASGPADHRARHHPARDHRPADALGDAGSAGRGLYPHRARQGHVGNARGRRARAAQRADPGRHHHRPADRPSARRRRS